MVTWYNNSKSTFLAPLSLSWKQTGLETRGSCVAHLSFCFEKTLYQTFHRCFLSNFGSFGYSVSEKIFFKITRKKNCLWWTCSLTNQDEMSNLYRGPSIDASYQVLVHLAKRFQNRRFKKVDQSKTRIACGGHVC